MIVVDASVWVAAFDSDNPANASCAALIRDADAQLVTLDLALYEVANVVSRWPDQRLAQAVVRTVELSVLRIIRVTTGLAERARALAASSRLSAYDAAYVIAARDERCQLVSLDQRDLVGPGHAVTPADALPST